MKTSLIGKLGIAPAMRILLLNAPPGYTDLLGVLPQGAMLVSRPRGPVDLVQLFCGSLKELKEGLPRAMGHLRDDSVLWICWPKNAGGRSTDVNRDILWRVLLQASFKPVTSISLDDTWSALRFKAAPQ